MLGGQPWEVWIEQYGHSYQRGGSRKSVDVPDLPMLLSDSRCPDVAASGEGPAALTPLNAGNAETFGLGPGCRFRRERREK